MSSECTSIPLSDEFAFPYNRNRNSEYSKLVKRRNYRMLISEELLVFLNQGSKAAIAKPVEITCVGFDLPKLPGIKH